MITKIEAGRIATRAGCHGGGHGGPTVRSNHCLSREQLGLLLMQTCHKLGLPEAYNHRVNYILTMGCGCFASSKSLLAAGICPCTAALIAVIDFSLHRPRRDIGRGISNYSAEDVAHCRPHSAQIPIFGYRGRDEVIHADDMVVDHSPDLNDSGAKR